MDKIYIRDLAVNTIIGTLPEERKKKQKLIFNIEISCDLSRAGKSDDLKDSIDYKKIYDNILELAEMSCFFLLEKLALETAKICLADKKAVSVKVTIDKPGALSSARCPGVEIERFR